MSGPHSPTEPAPPSLLARRGLGPALPLYLKREDTHELGAFKWRGALPSVGAYRDAGAEAVVTASTGNHGAAVAWSCRRLGLGCTVFGPVGCSESKLELIRAQGASVLLEGDDLDEAKDAARSSARERGLPFFEDGREPAQLDGYGAIVDEILEQLGTPPAAVFVPLGNGALLIGVARALRASSPATRVVAALAREAPVMARSVAAGHAVAETRCETFADGLAVRVAIPEAVEEIVRLGPTVVEVSEQELARAVGDYAAAGIRVEGSAAAALAACSDPSREGPSVLLVTGRNIDESLFRRAVEQPETFPA